MYFSFYDFIYFERMNGYVRKYYIYYIISKVSFKKLRF